MVRRPPRLNVGDTVAVLSTSWGGPHVFPRDAGAIAVYRDVSALRDDLATGPLARYLP